MRLRYAFAQRLTVASCGHKLPLAPALPKYEFVLLLALERTFTGAGTGRHGRVRNTGTAGANHTLGKREVSMASKENTQNKISLVSRFSVLP